MRTWLLTMLISFSVADASKRKTGEVLYKLNFLESFSDCENFMNDVMDTSNLEIEHFSPSNSVLNGNVIFSSPIEEGTQILISAFKETGTRREFLYKVGGDLCSQMEDPDTPWAPFFLALGVNSCPIEAKTYPVEKLQFNLDFVKKVMKHEFLGEYYAKFELQKPAREFELVPSSLSCHGIALSVIAVKNDDD